MTKIIALIALIGGVAFVTSTNLSSVPHTDSQTAQVNTAFNASTQVAKITATTRDGSSIIYPGDTISIVVTAEQPFNSYAFGYLKQNGEKVTTVKKNIGFAKNKTNTVTFNFKVPTSVPAGNLDLFFNTKKNGPEITGSSQITITAKPQNPVSAIVPPSPVEALNTPPSPVESLQHNTVEVAKAGVPTVTLVNATLDTIDVYGESGIKARFKIKVNSPIDLSKDIAVGVLFTDEKGQSSLTSQTFGSVRVLNSEGFIKKSVDTEVEFTANLSLSGQIIPPGKKYKASINDITWTNRITQEKIRQQTGLERLVSSEHTSTGIIDRSRSLTSPASKSVLKKGQTYQFEIAGYIGDISANSHVYMQKVKCKNVGYCMKETEAIPVLFKLAQGKRSYSFTIPSTLEAGDYFMETRSTDDIQSGRPMQLNVFFQIID